MGRVCSVPLSGRVEDNWPVEGKTISRGIYLSCGDSAKTLLTSKSIDLVVTDPPFFDNVHYSELADFFHAWQQIGRPVAESTRNRAEVQDSDASSFARKLCDVFSECHRILKDDGLLVFTYHHSRDEGWASLADAVLGAGFYVVNSQPVKAEMSGATPKSQAKEPIQFDIVIVCRKRDMTKVPEPVIPRDAIESARAKLERLQNTGFSISRNDRKIIFYGQLLTTLSSTSDVTRLAEFVESELSRPLAKKTRAKPKIRSTVVIRCDLTPSQGRCSMKRGSKRKSRAARTKHPFVHAAPPLRNQLQELESRSIYQIFAPPFGKSGCNGCTRPRWRGQKARFEGLTMDLGR